MGIEAKVNGTTIHHEVVGEGPTCLVLPGWPGTDHTYLRPGLDRLGERLRLVYVDHRGHGRSGRPPLHTLTVEQLADDADGLAAELGAGAVLVLGHFHGSFVAQELALRHPERVAGLILVAATPGELGRAETLLDDLGPPTPVEVEVLQRVPPSTDAELEASMRMLATSMFARPDAAAEQAPFAACTFDAASAGRWMSAMGWWSSVDRLGGLSAPVLLVTGRDDVFAPPEQAERLRRLVAGAEAVVLEGTGHLPWAEEPDALLAAVAAWLDRHSSNWRR